MPASASDSVRASAMTPTIVVQAGMAEPGSPRDQAQTDAFADRILVGPVDAGRGLVDDCDQGRSFKVLVDEKASAQERHAQQVEVFGRNDGTVSISGGLIAPSSRAFANQWQLRPFWLWPRGRAARRRRPLLPRPAGSGCGGEFRAAGRLPAWRCGR